MPRTDTQLNNYGSTATITILNELGHTLKKNHKMQQTLIQVLFTYNDNPPRLQIPPPEHY